MGWTFASAATGAALCARLVGDTGASRVTLSLARSRLRGAGGGSGCGSGAKPTLLPLLPDGARLPGARPALLPLRLPAPDPRRRRPPAVADVWRDAGRLSGMPPEASPRVWRDAGRLGGMPPEASPRGVPQ